MKLQLLRDDDRGSPLGTAHIEDVSELGEALADIEKSAEEILTAEKEASVAHAQLLTGELAEEASYIETPKAKTTAKA